MLSFKNTNGGSTVSSAAVRHKLALNDKVIQSRLIKNYFHSSSKNYQGRPDFLNQLMIFYNT